MEQRQRSEFRRRVQIAADVLFKTASPTSISFKSEPAIAGGPTVLSLPHLGHGPVAVQTLTDGCRRRGDGPALVLGPASIHL